MNSCTLLKSHASGTRWKGRSIVALAILVTLLLFQGRARAQNLGPWASAGSPAGGGPTHWFEYSGEFIDGNGGSWRTVDFYFTGYFDPYFIDINGNVYEYSSFYLIPVWRAHYDSS